MDLNPPTPTHPARFSTCFSWQCFTNTWRWLMDSNPLPLSPHVSADDGHVSPTPDDGAGRAHGLADGPDSAAGAAPAVPAHAPGCARQSWQHRHCHQWPGAEDHRALATDWGAVPGRFVTAAGDWHSGQGEYDGSGELLDCLWVDWLWQQVTESVDRMNVMDQVSWLWVDLLWQRVADMMDWINMMGQVSCVIVLG